MTKRSLFLFLMLAIPAAATTLDVTDYGANPADNGGDDSSAVQAALDDCGPGDAVFFPAGTYSIGGVSFDDDCKHIYGIRDQSVLKARTNDNFAVLYSSGLSNDQWIHDLVVDNNGIASDGIKFDAFGSPRNLTIQFIRFKGGGTGIEVISGMAEGSEFSSIDHNIFQNLGGGIGTFFAFSKTHIDFNYFDQVFQGISASCNAGVDGAPEGNNTTVDHNTFLHGTRMAMEFCGRFNNISTSNNYIADWNPSPHPNTCPEPFEDLFPEFKCPDGPLCNQPPNFCERHAVCGAAFPYMCDSMGISMASGGTGIRVDGNRIYRQAGTSWGIEYSVQAPGSGANGNHIWEAGVAIFDDACGNQGAPNNCELSRLDIINNRACGSTKGDQSGFFANWPNSNQYFLNCPGGMPAKDPVPNPPFGPGISNCTITFSAFGTFTVGQTTPMTFTASGCGVGTLTWTSGGLPNGRTGCNAVQGNSCTVTGTYSAAGNFSPSIGVSDGGSNSASVNPSINVVVAPSVTTLSLPNGTTGSAYSQALATTGGVAPVTCSLTGSLPTFRVNAGGSSFTDGSGNAWAADSGFSAGSRTFTDSTPIGGTTDDLLYQDGRVSDDGTLLYAATLPNGTYNVTLKFVEQFQFGAGLRVMGVSIEGVLKLDNYDIFAQAGAFTAKDEVLNGIVVSDGQLNISFVSSADLPTVAAIQIVPVSGGGEITGSGLTVNSGCTITGTGGTAGTYNFGVTPTDANGIAGASRSLSITLVNPTPNTGTELSGTFQGVSVQ